MFENIFALEKSKDIQKEAMGSHLINRKKNAPQKGEALNVFTTE